MPALTGAELTSARAMQALAMQDECTVERYTGESVWDPVTESTTRGKVTVYTGACRAQAKAVQAGQVVQADEELVILQFSIAIPWDHTDVQVDDLITVTTSADPLLAVTVLRVAAVEASTFATARHLTCTTQLD